MSRVRRKRQKKEEMGGCEGLCGEGDKQKAGKASGRECGKRASRGWTGQRRKGKQKLAASRLSHWPHREIWEELETKKRQAVFEVQYDRSEPTW